MTTKEQERKALEQIRKIVAGLGEDSYIGRAFDGCMDMAQENIDNDFWDSMKERAELNEAEAEKWIDKAESFKARAEKAEELFNQKTELASKYFDCWQKSCESAAMNMELVEERDARINDLEQEVIRLKAKLYDLICK